jgi:hypothetical protein
MFGRILNRANWRSGRTQIIAAAICVVALGAGVGGGVVLAQLQGGNPASNTENGAYCNGLGFPCLNDTMCSMEYPCPAPGTSGCFDYDGSATCSAGTSNQNCESLPSFQCDAPIRYDGTCSGGNCNFSDLVGLCGKTYYPDCTGSQ